MVGTSFVIKVAQSTVRNVWVYHSFDEEVGRVVVVREPDIFLRIGMGVWCVRAEDFLFVECKNWS